MAETTLREHLKRVGVIGGQSKSEKKIAAVQNNLARAREARWKNKAKLDVDSKRD